jgi:hypothetical protein
MSARLSRSWRDALATSRRLRTALIAVFVLAALYAAYRYTLHRMVESKLNEMRQQGYPVTLAELDKWYPQPPPSENAAEIYRRAFAKNVKLGKEECCVPIVGCSNLPPRGVSMPKSMLDGIARYLDTNQESLVLLHEATAMAHCRFTTNLSVSVIQNTQDAGLRQAARKLGLATVYAASSGDAESTTKSLLASIGLVRHFSDEPLAIPRLVQQACFGLTKEVLEHSLSSLQLDPKQLASISAALESTEASSAIDRVMISEMAWHNDIFSEMRGYYKSAIGNALGFYEKASLSDWTKLLLVLGYRSLGILDFDQLNYLRLESTAIRISEQPPPQSFPALESFAGETNHVSALLPGSRMEVGFSCQFLKLDARFVASLRATRAGVAVESYRAEHGQLPDSLPSNLIDPFDGQPLRYKKLPKGYVVYSVGEDGKDDGGDEKKDITFTVER